MNFFGPILVTPEKISILSISLYSIWNFKIWKWIDRQWTEYIFLSKLIYQLVTTVLPSSSVSPKYFPGFLALLTFRAKTKSLHYSGVFGLKKTSDIKIKNLTRNIAKPLQNLQDICLHLISSLKKNSKITSKH